MDNYSKALLNGESARFPTNASSLQFARTMDKQDDLGYLRDEFILPTKASLKKLELDGSIPGTLTSLPIYHRKIVNGANRMLVQSTLHSAADGRQAGELEEQGLYFVGNSLGAQPKAVREYVDAQLETWASIGVKGHPSKMGNSPLVAWQDLAEHCAQLSADLIGALAEEIVIMNTLTTNLHLLMASFYKPLGKRNKIILEWRPFPSDYFAIESHLVWHGLDSVSTMVKIEPDSLTDAYIPLKKIMDTIDQHAEDAALLLLPGIQYYSGQLFDIAAITAYAKARGITVGWDLAHAVGNVELRLHDWNVDFAVWCNYKYVNAGPGAIGGAFVHEKHGKVEFPHGQNVPPAYHPRLAGWYGGEKATRFNMDNVFLPIPGAAGFQLSNPSAIDLASLSGALSVFYKTSMKALRSKAVVITAYAEFLLDEIVKKATDSGKSAPLRIITPRDPRQRGTQLSVLLQDGLLDPVSAALEENGVLCDKRKPGVIRVAPVPLYTRFEDVWKFMEILGNAVESL